MSEPTKAALQAGIERLTKEAGGVLDVMVIQLQDMPYILCDAAAGDRDALTILNALNDALVRIDAAPRRFPMLCVSCPRPLRKGRFSFGLALPKCDHPTGMLALAVCHRCSTDRDGIKARAVAGLKRLWPDLRPITVTHTVAGTA